MSAELIKRIFTSMILLGIALYVITSLNQDYFLYFMLILGIICAVEWFVTNQKILDKLRSGFKPYINTVFKSKKFYKYFSIYFFGIVYFLFVLPMSAFYLRFEESLSLFLILLFICICSDTGGYFIGKIIGGKKLTKISPNKTISGSVGSFIFSILPILVVDLLNIGFISFQLNLKNILFSLFVCLICQLGDLFFSYFKRLNKRKNTGTLLPGHGGLLDRIDGLVVVLPVVFFLKIIEII
jgi:phosphatidate cytidylyltransferase